MTSPSEPVQSPADRRKLVAVVHADIVGYSRLIGLEDVGTLERVRTLRRDLIDPTIAEHGGRIVNTAGDALLVVFDSVDGAMRCAVAVQRQVPAYGADQRPDRRISFRIGINVGDAIPDGTDLHGDVVNVAARLQAVCPPGDICVSRGVREHVGSRLDLAFEALGLLNLKNITQPVDAFVLRPDAPTIAKSVDVVDGAGEALPLPGKPSIAVLAFTNMSGDPEQEYFSDGIADDIVTELSRNHSLFVIARNSSFTYKGRAVDIRQVARELGVRYVLEGSVRHSTDRVRVNAQLIDAETGNHIWAERYDRALEDVFAVQDEITTAVVTAIQPAVADAEFRRVLRKPPESLNAWEAYLRGQWHNGQSTEADNERAKEFFQRAIALDPTFASPYAALAQAYSADGPGWGTRSFEDAAELSAGWARKAIAIDPEDADARAMVSMAAMVSGNMDEAYDQAQLARTSSPNSPMALAMEGHVLLHTGRPAQARQAMAACLRLDPRGPLSAAMMHRIAITYYYERDYTKSAEASFRCLARYPGAVATYRWLTAALGQLGRMEEARAALHKALELSPRLFELYTRRRPPWHSPGDYEHMLDGLRKAGWQG